MPCLAKSASRVYGNSRPAARSAPWQEPPAPVVHLHGRREPTQRQPGRPPMADAPLSASHSDGDPPNESRWRGSGSDGSTHRRAGAEMLTIEVKDIYKHYGATK